MPSLPVSSSSSPPPLSGLLVPTIALAHARLLVHVVALRGIDKARLLAEADVNPSLLAREQGEVYATEYVALVKAALRLTADPCLGLEVGMNMPPTMHGSLGHALLSAGNLAEALEMAVTYWSLMGRYLDVSLTKSEHEMRLRVTERLPLGPLQRFVLDGTLAGWIHAAKHLLGATPNARSSATLCFAAPYDPAFDRYASRLPDVKFDCEVNEIVIPLGSLDRSLPLAHPEAARQARAACDAALARMAQDGGIVHQVAEALALTQEGYPTMERVAQRMGITARTLARHLDRHGLTFRQVLDERRHREACSMLIDGNQPVEDIAHRLGYNDPANFTRAFRRWAGCTPTQYRQQHRDRPVTR